MQYSDKKARLMRVGLFGFYTGLSQVIFTGQSHAFSYACYGVIAGSHEFVVWQNPHSCVVII